MNQQAAHIAITATGDETGVETRVGLIAIGVVAFLDSSGLGAVVAARKLLGAGRALDLAGLQPAVEQVMVLTRMNTVFEIHRDVATAMEAHGSAPAA